MATQWILRYYPTIENYVAIATQQIENYVSIARNLYRKLCLLRYN